MVFLMKDHILSLKNFDQNHSVLKAITGSCFAAFLDGMKPATTVRTTAMIIRETAP